MISLPRLNEPPKSAPVSRRLRCLTPASIRLRHVLGLERPRDVAGAIPRGHQLRVVSKPIPHDFVQQADLLADVAGNGFEIGARADMLAPARTGRLHRLL